MKYWLGVMAGSAVWCLLWWLSGFRREGLLEKRLKRPTPEEYALRELERNRAQARRSMLTGLLERLQREAREVGLRAPGTTVLFLLVGVPVAAFGLTYLLTQNVLAALVCGAAGAFAPEVLVREKRRKRYQEFLSKFDSALLMAASSLQAGASVQQALQEIAEKASPSVADEFVRVMQAIRLGATPGDAVKLVLETRVPGPETKMFVVATQTLMKTGGNLAEVYTQLARMIVEQREFRDAMKAATAENRVTATVLTVLPIASVMLVLMGNPGYFSPFMELPGGQLILFGSVVALAVGWVLIRKILQVQVD